jgi:hypothetical protein
MLVTRPCGSESELTTKGLRRSLIRPKVTIALTFRPASAFLRPGAASLFESADCVSLRCVAIISFVRFDAILVSA